MKLADLPRLLAALDLLGIDNGADVVRDAEIPAQWRPRAEQAEAELAALGEQEIRDLVMGDHPDQRRIAQRAPNADAVLFAAFDGELADAFFTPWPSIHDARRAVARHEAGGEE